MKIQLYTKKLLKIQDLVRAHASCSTSSGLMNILEREARRARPMRCQRTTFPTEWFLSLQLLYAQLLLYGKTGAALDLDEDQSRDVLEQAMDHYPESHLLCHATEGFYIALDYKGQPVFDTNGDIPGGWIGSSYRLLEELLELVVVLDIELAPLTSSRNIRRGGGYDISRESIDFLNQNALAPVTNAARTRAYGREKVVWFALYEAAQSSVQSSSTIILE